MATEYPTKVHALDQAALQLRISHDALADAKGHLHAAGFNSLSVMLDGIQTALICAANTAADAAALGLSER